MEHKRSRISARCKKCQAVVGRFDNAWLRITGSYYLPRHRDDYDTPGLHVQGREKAASIGTALDGTLIRPLACLECADYLGFLCTKAPESKASFSHREFFKLPRMELRCDATNRLVQPVVDNDHRDMDPLPHHLHHQHPSPALASAPAHASAPASTAPSSSHQSPVPAHAQAQLYQKQQPYPPIQSAKRPSPPPPSARSSPYSIPAATPSANGYPPSNGVYQPSREHEVAMDAINRLQTQVQYNTAGLHTQRRDFEAVKDSVSRLSEDFHNVLESLRRELQARPIAPVPAAAPAPPANSHLDDATLEVFASNLSTIATKANEIDALKMQLEIVKRRIKIMEDNGASGSAATPSANIAPAQAPGLAPFVPSHEQAQALHTVHQMHPAQLQHPSQPIQQYHNHTTPPMPRLGTPGRVDVRTDARPPVQPLPSYHHTTSQEMAHAHETSAAPQASQAGQASGWVSVNPSVKRGHPNSIESPGEGRQEALGSPKRPKLAPLEPRVGQENATPVPYDRMQTEDGSFAVQQPVESHYEQPSSTPSTFIQYSQSNDAAMEAYRAPASADKPRRGRGGGRGRGRRSMPADGRELGTPEWDKPDWNGTRLSPEGYYSVTATQDGAKDHRGNTIVRRGSGGGPIAMRPIELARPGTSGGDPYAHTKKTRTKPVRNADGVLIRKDGRPDMRSQSSAANLRKVHARKEHERALEQRGNTPTSGIANDSMAHTSQGSQGSATPDPEAAPPTTQERHEQIMKQIFPRGVEESNRRNFHEQYFPPNSSPGTVPRVKPEMNTPSDRGDSSEGSQAEAANGRSPTAEPQRADAMEVEQTSATAVAH